METGQLRELKLKLGYFVFARWSPTGGSSSRPDATSKGRNNGLYRIDVQTGDATLVVASRAAVGKLAAVGRRTASMCSTDAVHR